jgi:hypothetical protein
MSPFKNGTRSIFVFDQGGELQDNLSACVQHATFDTVLGGEEENFDKYLLLNLTLQVQAKISGFIREV